MLGREDQLVQLAVHAHKHGFSRLIWLKDIDLLVRSEGDRADWDLVTRAARREGVVGSLWYSLSLISGLLGTPLPVSAARIRPSAPLRRLFSILWPEARIAALEGKMRRRAVQLHVADSWRGVLPSLLLMGRRGERVVIIARSLLGRRPRSPSAHDSG